MRLLWQRQLRRWRQEPDAGMTMAEMIVTIAIGAIVLSMLGTVTVTLLKTDRRNLVREVGTAEARQVSIWVGEALTYASSELSAEGSLSAKPAISAANPDSITFTSAMPVEGMKGEKGALSEITLQLGQKCWTTDASGADPGVLYRCVKAPKALLNGTPVWCEKDKPDCPENLFESMVVARGVKDTEPIFKYYLRIDDSGANSGKPLELDAGQTSVVPAKLGSIAGVEFRVTVADEIDGKEVDSTVYKYFSINEWNWI